MGRPPKDGVAKTGRQRVREHNARDAEVEIDFSTINWTRRNGTKDSLRAFQRAYFARRMPLPCSADQEEQIARTEEAIKSGGCHLQAAPRGDGKTERSVSAAMWGVLHEWTRFAVLIAADAGKSKDLLADVINELADNELIAEDWPHISAVVRECRDNPQRARYLNFDGKRLDVTCKVDKLVLPTVAGAPDGVGGSVLRAGGITAALRGMRYTPKGKAPVRPDFVMLDDPQTDESAASEEQTKQRERLLKAAVRGLAGPDKRLAVVCNANPIAPGDLIERLLDARRNPEWKGKRYSLLYAWPDAKGTLWKEYEELYRDDLQDKTTKATEFYVANRAAMDAGAVAAWEYRVRPGEVSAIQTAMNLWIESGDDAFASEYQCAPISKQLTLGPYELRPAMIVKRTDATRAPGTVPEWVVHTVAATDINPSYGLTWAVVGFGADSTAAVLAYGVYRGEPLPIPGDTPAAERARRVYEALAAHGRKLAALPCKPESWIIDASGTDFDAVLRFGRESVQLCGLQALGATGRGWKAYRPYGRSVVGAPREKCHMAIDQARRPPPKWLVWHADYWRENAQRAWLGEAGAPGTVTLPAGVHVEFAEQVCREQLKGRDEVGGQTVWVWATQPGPHDYGDCMAMAFAGAAWGGIGTGGRVVRAVRPVRVVRSAAPRRVASVPLDESLL